MPYLTLLRAVAALLIVNSHLEAQHLIPQAAVDGLLGNSLFFFLSGLGLVAGERNSRRGFLDWYGRRVSRIVPSVVLAVLVLDYWPSRGWDKWTTFEHFRNFLAPPHFTFVEQILLLYIPFFFVQRLGGRRGNDWALGLSVAAMAIVPALGDRSALFHPFHWLYYFSMMLFGASVAWRGEPTRPSTPRRIGGFVLAGLAYGAAKLATSRPAFSEWYPAVHFLAFPLLYTGIGLAQAERVGRFVDRHRWLRGGITLVSGLTLEIYLVHYAVRDSPVVARLAFPVNIAAILIGSVGLAIPLARGADLIRGSWRGIAEIARAKSARSSISEARPRLPTRHHKGSYTNGR